MATGRRSSGADEVVVVVDVQVDLDPAHPAAETAGLGADLDSFTRCG